MAADAPHEELTDTRRVAEPDIMALQKELDDKQNEIRRLQETVRGLQAEIRILRSSMSWALTRPLRSLARGLPGLAAFGQLGFDKAKDILVGTLPKTLSETLLDNRWNGSTNLKEQIVAYRNSSPAGGRRIVFYTAVFGDYDNLLLPEWIDPSVDYVCFTDRPRNNYGMWQMRSAPYYHPDPTRIARYVKTHPHELFPSHEVAVWLDANVILKGDIRKYIEMTEREGAHLGLVQHPHRQCFYEEAEACKRLRKDGRAIIDAQVEHYRKHGLPSNQPLFETGFMVVPLRNAERTAVALHTWWQQIERFSRRDQLGFAWVAHRLPDLRITPLLPHGASLRDHEDFHYFRHNYARALVTPKPLLQLGTAADPSEGASYSQVKSARLLRLEDEPIDIIVCVHNALEDVRLCLESAWENLLPHHRIVIVNDCSDDETTSYLRTFAADKERVALLENEENLGYTRSANRGLAAGAAGFRILLNSDTIVCRNWALKMLDVATRSDTIGIVGALSNAAGAQSIPYIKGRGNNTAINVLPNGLSLPDLDLACEEWSFADLFPRVPLVHGFCFGVKKELIDSIGLFDDRNFKRFYGEENDYCFRALAAGFELAIATNTFVFHRKSRSIDEEKRVLHMAEAWKRLRELYGAERILSAYRQLEEHPLLDRIRRRAASHFKAVQAGSWSREKV